MNPQIDPATGERVNIDPATGERIGVTAAAPAPKPAPPQDTRSAAMRLYESPGQEVMGAAQGMAQVVQDIGRAITRSKEFPNGLSDLVKKYPARQEGFWKTAFDAYKSLNPIAIKHKPLTQEQAAAGRQKGSLDLPSTIGATVGRLALLGFSPEARDVGEGIGEAATGAKRNLARAVTHTATPQTEEFVAETLEKNKAARAKAAEQTAAAETKHQEAQAKVDEANAIAAAKHEKKAAAVAEENSAKQAEHAARVAKTEELKKAAAETETRRGQLARQTSQQGARMVERLRRVYANAKASTDAQWEELRNKLGDKPADRAQLSAAVRKAEGSLSGSRENIKVFRDILSREGEDVARPLLVDGREILPTDYGYEDIRAGYRQAGILNEGAPLTYKDLQGYYTELGEKLSTGNLPGDVFQATKNLRESISDMMQKIATQNRMGGALAKARADYTAFMEAFREPTGAQHSGSPLAQSLQAKDPAYAVQPLTVPETAQRIRNALARFDPAVEGQGGGAALYDNFLKAHREYEGLPKQGAMEAKIKQPSPPKLSKAPEPPMPKPALPAPKPVEPAILRPGTEELAASKRENVLKEAKSISQSGKWLLPFTALHAARELMSGNFGMAVSTLADIPVYLAGRAAVARAMKSPNFMDFVTAATPKDIEILRTLPADERGVIQQRLTDVVAEVRRQGKAISPQLAAFVAGGKGLAPKAGQPTTEAPPAPHRNPSDEWSHPLP